MIDEKNLNVMEKKDESTDIEHLPDFISIYRNVYPDGYCQHMISEFERLKANKIGWNRHNKKHAVDDYSLIIMPGVHSMSSFKNMNPSEGFFKKLQECYDDYSKKYSFLLEVNTTCSSFKMQKTEPTQGYHIYHAEIGNQSEHLMYQNRVVVFSLYLNTLDQGEGGETEFLYQKRRIPAVENTMILWPASYTHLHRGNAVLGDKSKYIITGWFYYGT